MIGGFSNKVELRSVEELLRMKEVFEDDILHLGAYAFYMMTGSYPSPYIVHLLSKITMEGKVDFN